MNNIKTFFHLLLPFCALILFSCTTVKYYPVNFVESLKHPTKFPEVFSFTVQNIEEVAEKNPLGENEEVKIIEVGENKNSSLHLVRVRENGELRPHYHKRHDEVIYVKKGSGIATLDGTRYMIKPGSILQIPSKTVHKFLNTGGETFMAVSIFSPPFDGRDEKNIKEKRKADRGTKEEKRIAAKKPEKVTEDKSSTVAVNEPTEEEIQKAAVTSKKVAVKNLNKPTHEEWNTDTEKPYIPPKKSFTPEDKKKSKEVVSNEDPSVDINELQEKLTKLMGLKEEGTISAEEYEEMKDSLVSGKETGKLPELKSPMKKKKIIEDEPVAEPILKQVEKRVPIDEDVSDENQDTMLSTPSLPEEIKPTVDEVKTGKKESLPEDKLKLLKEMKQEGLITEEDYERKKEEFSDTIKEETVSRISETTSKDERIKELKELYDQELITEDDYKYKLKELIDSQAQDLSSDTQDTGVNKETTVSTPSENTAGDEKVKELKELYNQGLITEDDYIFKLKELTGVETKNFSPTASADKEIKNDKLSELYELKEQGLITEEDYEFKKAQLLGK